MVVCKELGCLTVHASNIVTDVRLVTLESAYSHADITAYKKMTFIPGNVVRVDRSTLEHEDGVAHLKAAVRCAVNGNTATGRKHPAGDVWQACGVCGISADASYPSVLAHACIALTARNEATDTVLGFAAFFPRPKNCSDLLSQSDASALRAWASAATPASAELHNSLSISCLLLHPEHEKEVLTVLMQSALDLFPTCSKLLLVSEAAVPLTQPHLAAHFRGAEPLGPSGESLAIADALSFLPPLVVRKARIEDHDDIAPLLDDAVAEFGTLAKVPTGDSAVSNLADFLGTQDSENIVLIGTEPGEGTVCGILAASGAVDALTLLEHYDLLAYDGLLPPEIFETLYQRAEVHVLEQRQKEADETYARLVEKARAAALSTISDAAIDEASKSTAEGTAPLDEAVEAAGAAAADSAAAAVPRPPPAPPTAKDLQAALLHAACGLAEPPAVSAMALRLLAASQTSVSSEITRRLLSAVFTAMPDSDWLVLTLPFDVPLPKALHSFDCLQPRPGSAFPFKLCLIHREANASVSSRCARPADLHGVSELVAGTTSAAEFAADFGCAMERNMAAVSLWQGTVVAAFVFDPTGADGDVLNAANVTLPDSLDASDYPPDTICHLRQAAVNPIFTSRSSELLLHALITCGHSLALVPVPCGKAWPAITSAMAHAPTLPSSSTTVHAFAPPLAFHTRIPLHCRIVIVGASTTGLSALRVVVADSTYDTPFISVLAPGGAEAAAALADPHLVAATQAPGVTVIDASLESLDPAAQTIELSTGTTMPYDLLILTPGLQNTTLATVAACGVQGVCSPQELRAHFTRGDAAAAAAGGPEQRIIVYGDTLEATDSLAVLEERGVDLGRGTVHVAPPPGAGGPDPVVTFMRQMIKTAGLSLELPSVGVLTRLEASADQDTFQCFFDTSSHSTTDPPTTPLPAPESVISAVLVAAEAPDITASLATALHAAGIVYDGRIVADAEMRACGMHAVLAAGPAAKFSRTAGGLRHSTLPSAAVGTALGTAVLRTAARAAAAPLQLPTGGRPAACRLPGGGCFVLVGTPAQLAEPAAAAASAATVSERGHCKIVLDAAGAFVQIAYAGRDDGVTAEALGALVGVHSAIVHPDLCAAVRSKEVTCLVGVLTAAWLQPTVNPNFRELLDTLTTSVAAMFGPTNTSEPKKSAQDPKEAAALRLALLDCKDAVAQFVATGTAPPVAAQ